MFTKCWYTNRWSSGTVSDGINPFPQVIVRLHTNFKCWAILSRYTKCELDVLATGSGTIWKAIVIMLITLPASQPQLRTSTKLRQNLSFRVLHARQSATVHSAWLQLGREIPWHCPCSPLSHLQFFDVAWRLNCSRAPFQIKCFSERSMLRNSVNFTTLKSLDHNVVMTFKFNNNNNNNNNNTLCRARWILG